MVYNINNFVIKGDIKDDIENIINYDNVYHLSILGENITDKQWEQGFIEFSKVKKILLELFSVDEQLNIFLKNKGKGWYYGELIFNDFIPFKKFLYLPIVDWDRY